MRLLWLLIGLLCILWLISVIVKFTLGGLIHILLIVAIILGIVQLFRRRSA